MRRTLIITVLLLTVAAVQPQYEMPLCTCRADSISPKFESVQNDGRTPSTEAPTEIPDEILIGYFGPDDVNHPEGGDMWCAATLAIEQANKAGGYEGRPFKLITGWSENPWGSGVTDVARMAYQHNVLAIIGGIDGPSTHLAEQVVAKARLPLLSGGNADRTANLANVSWMFCSLPGHHLQAAALAEAVEALIAGGRLVVVSTVDHDSHVLSVEIEKCFHKRQIAPRYHFHFECGQSDNSELVNRIVKANAKAVVIIAPLRDSAQMCVDLRSKGFDGAIFGGPCMSRRMLVDTAGDAVEGTVFPVLYKPSEGSRAFEQAFFNHFRRHGDYLSAHTYDTVNILVEAIRRAGLDRERIRDEIRKLSPYSGVTGTICWDKRGSNCRRISTGTISNGRVRILGPHHSITYSSTAPSTPPQ